MSLILVDTSAWIEFYHPRGSRQIKQAIANALGVHEVAVVAPVMVELLTGARTEGYYRLLNEDLQALEWLPLVVEETQMASKLAYQLARAGQRVPTVDLLIAGSPWYIAASYGTLETLVLQLSCSTVFYPK